MDKNPPSLAEPPEGYADWLADLKAQVHTARQRAALAVNTEMLQLYWRIGRDILDRQARQGWGAKVIDRLSHDLRSEFPDLGGFSARNLKYMRKFAAVWPEAFVQQPAAQIPWGHHLVLLDKLATPEERHWYARNTLAYGWSRNVLTMEIETRRSKTLGAGDHELRSRPA